MSKASEIVVMFQFGERSHPAPGDVLTFSATQWRCFVDPVFSRSHVRSERTVDFFACNATLPTRFEAASGSDSSEPPSLGTGAQLEPAESKGQQTPSTVRNPAMIPMTSRASASFGLFRITGR